LPAVIAALDEATARAPNDGRTAFYAGVMRLWRLAERERNPNYPVQELARDTERVLSDLERAQRLRPESPHAAAFFGVAQVTLGRLVGDEQRIDQGKQILDTAVPLYPAYVEGVRAIAFGSLARDHRYFPEAATAFMSAVRQCNNVTESPDGLSFTYRTDAPGTCHNEGVVAHVWEGILFTAGDIAVKSGDAAGARVFYAAAKQSPTYDQWSVKSVLEEHAAKADEHSRLYLDADSSNDPQTWMTQSRLCVGCHQRTP
jgi:hypothetical protein